MKNNNIFYIKNYFVEKVYLKHSLTQEARPVSDDELTSRNISDRSCVCFSIIKSIWDNLLILPKLFDLKFEWTIINLSHV